MMRVLGTLSRVHGRLFAGFCGVADGRIITGAFIIYRTLSLTFFAMDTIAYQKDIGMLCTDSSSFSIACPMPSPVSLLFRLVIAEVS